MSNQGVPSHRPIPSIPGLKRISADYRELFFKVLGLALKHRWLILICAAAGLLVGVYVTITATPIYQATATIEIQLEAPKVVKLDSPDPAASGANSYRFYQTQYDLLQSRSLAEKVAADMDLANAPGFLNPPSSSAWAKLWHRIFPAKATAGGSYAARKAWATGMVRGGLSITPVQASSLVRISYRSPSPEWAQKIANGVSETFIKQNMVRRYGATAYARQFLKDRLDEFKLKLEKSEEALVEYARKMKIVDVVSSSDQSSRSNKSGNSGNSGTSASDLDALNAALNQAQLESIKYGQLWKQAEATHGMKFSANTARPGNSGLANQTQRIDGHLSGEAANL